MRQTSLIVTSVPLLLVPLLAALGCGGSGGGGGGGGGSSCDSPRGTVRLSISPAACASISDACATIEVVAKSPQISTLIAQGKSPCTSTHSSPDGCALGAELWSMTFCLDASACGTQDFDLADVFVPVSSDSSRAISDTVTYCPVDEQGTALGNCAGTLVDQCEPSAVTTVYVNSFTPPPAVAAVTFSSATCVTTSTELGGLKHCDVHASGTAKGPVGSWFYPLSNPIFADNVILECGDWTLVDYGCRHDSGQPDTTSWSRIFDDLWISPTSYPSGTRNVAVTGQVQDDQYGDILATRSTTVTCGN